MPQRRLMRLLAVTLLVLTPAYAYAEITVTKSEQGAVVKVDGNLFAEYLTESGNKPAIWPIIGPTGKEMTRAFPMMKDRPNERQDHPWHRSLYFTHGDVNGVDFWAEPPIKNTGTIVHREFVKLASGEQGEIVTRNAWVSPDGQQTICEDERRFVFGADSQSRWIDVEVTVKATQGEVKFGDTKEGSFGVRVAGTMKVDAKMGGKIVNSRGQTDGQTWGKPAEWVDYHGPVGDEVLGIAIMDHPSSFRHPTHWHVRTYGLFAANPFGLKDFTGGKSESGDHTLASGESLTFRYRVLLHQGDEKEGRVAEVFQAYSQSK